MTVGGTAAGWYPDPQQPATVRYWDGQQWTAQTAPAAPAYQPGVMVTKQRKDTSHLLHLILTILTAGIWGLLVWLPITLWHKFGPRSKSVTRYR